MKQKWVLVEGFGRLGFRMGRVPFHRDLFDMNSKEVKCVGGGEWVIDRETKRIFLYGHSHQFGRCSMEQVKGADFWGRPSLDGYTVHFSSGELELQRVLSKENIQFNVEGFIAIKTLKFKKVHVNN